jgi:hypothetical protein
VEELPAEERRQLLDGLFMPVPDEHSPSLEACPQIACRPETSAPLGTMACYQAC